MERAAEVARAEAEREKRLEEAAGQARARAERGRLNVTARSDGGDDGAGVAAAERMTVDALQGCCSGGFDKVRRVSYDEPPAQARAACSSCAWAAAIA